MFIHMYKPTEFVMLYNIEQTELILFKDKYNVRMKASYILFLNSC